MNEQELAGRIEQMEQKIDMLYASVERVRKYFLVFLWGSVAMFALPLVGLVFAIPAFLSIYSSVGDLGL